MTCAFDCVILHVKLALEKHRYSRLYNQTDLSIRCIYRDVCIIKGYLPLIPTHQQYEIALSFICLQINNTKQLTNIVHICS